MLGGAMKIKSVGINLVSKLCSKISLCIIIALKIIQKKHPMEKKKVAYLLVH